MASLVCPSLNDAFLKRLEAVSQRALGVSHVSGRRLVEAVQRVSRAYTRERADLEELAGDDEALAARLQFYLPRDLLKLYGPLAELESVGALPSARSWKLLDLGAGLGTTSLGVARFAALRGAAERLVVNAIDRDPEALAIFAELARDVSELPGVAIELTTREADIGTPGFARSSALAPPYDLICLGLALNELDPGADEASRAQRRLERALELSRLLAPDGALVIVEPALRATSRGLQQLRDAIVRRRAAPYVFAPCLTREACPLLARERDFCHERLPCELPPALGAIAASAGLRDRDLTYSYLTLRNDARSLRELDASQRLFRAVSGQLTSKGKTEAWLCGETLFARAMRLDRQRSAANHAFEQAERGTILAIETSEAPAPGALLRIRPHDRIESLQSWRSDSTRPSKS